jgi:hypothetical protein
MSGYWTTVPVGVWTVTDTADALEAIKDLATDWTYDDRRARLHLFSTTDHKALIVDIKHIKKVMNISDYHDFIIELRRYIDIEKWRLEL